MAGKTYALQNTTNLVSGWATPYSGIPGVAPMNVYTVTVSSVQAFWRVKLQ